MTAMYETSAKLLGVDEMDIYWIHNPVGAPEWTRKLIPLAKTGKAAAVHPIGKRYIYLDNQCSRADELFDGCYRIPWEELLPADAATSTRMGVVITEQPAGVNQ